MGPAASGAATGLAAAELREALVDASEAWLAEAERGGDSSDLLNVAATVAGLKLVASGRRGVNCKCTRDTLLYFCCSYGRKDVLTLLLKMGAIIGSGSDSLRAACREGHRETVLLLLDSGVNVNAKLEDGLSFLHLACRYCHQEVVRLLLDRGADINAENDDGRTALDEASYSCSAALVLLLIGRGADLDHTDRRGTTALSRACKYGDRTIALLLVGWGAVWEGGAVNAELSEEFTSAADDDRDTDSDGAGVGVGTRGGRAGSPREFTCLSHARRNGFCGALVAERRKFLAWARRRAFLAVLHQKECLRSCQQPPTGQDFLVDRVLRVAHREIASYI